MLKRKNRLHRANGREPRVRWSAIGHPHHRAALVASPLVATATSASKRFISPPLGLRSLKEVLLSRPDRSAYEDGIDAV